ncbi:MAG TPA: hypothetical protein VML75_16345 [Kofleriaceae bacterium]|nr:hypothetical protein [Kofleriaceae bacterium]
MSRLAAIIALACAALIGCEKSGTRKEPSPEPMPQPPGPEQPPPGARVLLIGPSEGGEPLLFQWAPGHGAPRAVDVAGGTPIVSAATSPSGTALALTVRGISGADRLWHVTTSATGGAELPITLEPGATNVLGVSDDGRVIALEVGSALLVASQPEPGAEVALRTLPIGTLGKRVYGAALAADGSKLAFSAMDLSCSGDAGKMARCPVRLYGVDLTAAELLPRALTPASTPGTTAVSYDPQLLGPHGDHVLYLTTIRDTSPACSEHVNQCRYALERRPFIGGDPTLLEDDAVLGRMAPDGTLSFRRLDRPNGTQTWWGQSLLVAGTPASRTLVDRALDNRYHFWSPDSRWIAGQRRLEDHVELDAFGRDGALVQGPIGDTLRPIGWFGADLPAGRATLAEPPAVRGLRAAVELATAIAPGAAVAVSGVPAYAYASLTAPPPQLPPAALEPWLVEPGPRTAVLSRIEYCVLRDRLRARGVDLGAAHTLDPHLVVAAVPAPTSSLDPRTVAIDPKTPAVARFDGSAHGGGIVELVRASVPPSARRGERVRLGLVWRIVEPPGAAWQVFVHIDGTAQRIGADHAPAVCGPRAWTPGQLIADDFDVIMGNDFTGIAPGKYVVFVGWFQGAHRARASGTAEAIDDRVPLSSIDLQP